MIQIFNVVKMYDGSNPVLDNISLEITKGEFVFLTGPSGAGKTTILKILFGWESFEKGQVLVQGINVGKLTHRNVYTLRRSMGVVFQDYHLLDHLTTFDNVALPLRVAGAAPGQIRDHVLQLLEWVGLGDKVDVQPPFMSGGEKQRVAVARAVIGQPDLLLADEPTGNLDEAMAERLMRLFQELNRQGTTLLIATHDTSLPRRFLHPVLRLDQGELGHEATP